MVDDLLDCFWLSVQHVALLTIIALMVVQELAWRNWCIKLVTKHRRDSFLRNLLEIQSLLSSHI